MSTAIATVAAAALSASAWATTPTAPDMLRLASGSHVADAQFDMACLPDPGTSTVTCIDGALEPLQARLRVAANRRVEGRLALPASSVTVVVERDRGRDLRLRVRTEADRRERFTIRLPGRARTGDVLRVAVRYDPQGSATFLARLRFARCRR